MKKQQITLSRKKAMRKVVWMKAAFLLLMFVIALHGRAQNTDNKLISLELKEAPYQPEVDITTRGDFVKHTSTICSRSSRMNGSPPVRLMNFTEGNNLISSGVISFLLSVGCSHILHILQRIGQR